MYVDLKTAENLCDTDTLQLLRAVMCGAQAPCDAWLLYNEAPGGFVLARLEMAELWMLDPKASSQTSAHSTIALFLYLYCWPPGLKVVR